MLKLTKTKLTFIDVIKVQSLVTTKIIKSIFTTVNHA